jgi:hypothetical protein
MTAVGEPFQVGSPAAGLDGAVRRPVAHAGAGVVRRPVINAQARINQRRLRLPACSRGELPPDINKATSDRAPANSDKLPGRNPRRVPARAWPRVAGSKSRTGHRRADPT